MEDSKLDKIFFESLNGGAIFNRQEEQWKIVEARLNKNKRRWVWFLSSGVGLVAIVGLLTASNSIGNTTDNSVGGLILEERKEVSHEQTKDISKKKSLNQETKEKNEETPPLDLNNGRLEEGNTKQSEKTFPSVRINKVKTEVSADKEKCNCPDDEIQGVNSRVEKTTAKVTTEKPNMTEVLPKALVDDCFSIQDISQVQVRSTYSESRILPECGDYISLVKKKKWKPEITIFAGAGHDFILRDNPIDTFNLYPHVGLNLRFTKSLSMDLSYSQSEYSITHTSEFPDYSFLPDYNPQGSWVINETNMKLRTRNLDLLLKYDLISKSKIGISPILGIRLSNTYKADFNVEYVDVYAVEDTDFKLEPKDFALNYWITGMEIGYKRTPYTFALGFRTMIPRTESIYTFSDLYSIQASIHYRLK